MKNKAQFRETFDQVQDFLHRLIYEQDKMVWPLPPDFEERIRTLTETLDQFTAMTTAAMEEAGIDHEGLRKSKQRDRPPEVDDEAWAFIQELREKRKLALSYRRRVEETLNALKRKGLGKEGQDQGKAEQQSRKRSFDRLGGRRNWRPI